MKKRMVVLVCSLLILLQAAITCAEAKPDADDGRYSLFQGAYTTFDLMKGQSATSTSVFLIDSRTGKVKRYVNKIDEHGKYIETWVPTETPAEK